jgi:isopenicillin N synthase-like dioxygenase
MWDNANMAGAAFESRNQFFVPTIDITTFISDPASSSANDVVQKVRDACIETGFFQIVGHGMPKDIQDGLFQASKKFFALPMEEKLALDARKTVGRRGYDVLESQAYDPKVLSDLKEVRRSILIL